MTRDIALRTERARALVTASWAGRIALHYPGGKDHDQTEHGNWSSGPTDHLAGSQPHPEGGHVLITGVRVYRKASAADSSSVFRNIFGREARSAPSATDLSDSQRMALAELERRAPGLLESVGTFDPSLQIVFHDEGIEDEIQSSDALGVYNPDKNTIAIAGFGRVSSTNQFAEERTPEAMADTLIHEIGHKLDDLLVGGSGTYYSKQASIATRIREFVLSQSYSSPYDMMNRMEEQFGADLMGAWSYPVFGMAGEEGQDEEFFAEAVMFYYTDPQKLIDLDQAFGSTFYQQVESALGQVGAFSIPHRPQLPLEKSISDYARLMAALIAHSEEAIPDMEGWSIAERADFLSPVAKRRVWAQVTARTPVSKHYGPGPHLNGTPQSVHGSWSTGTDVGSIIDRARSGGFTVSPLTGEVPTSGFAVAVSGYEAHISLSKLTPRWVAEHRARAWSQFADFPGARWGGWFDEQSGEVFLDVSIVVDSRDEAIRLGREYGQIAVADLAAITRGDWENAFIDTGGRERVVARLTPGDRLGTVERMSKHYGPGDHESGSSQDTHGGDRASISGDPHNPDADESDRCKACGRESLYGGWFNRRGEADMEGAKGVRWADVCTDCGQFQDRRVSRGPKVQKHMGPGDHPSGSSQQAHAGNGVAPGPDRMPFDRPAYHPPSYPRYADSMLTALRARPSKMVPDSCHRCGGVGGWSGWPGYTCYRCRGDGMDPSLKVYAFPKSWTDGEIDVWRSGHEQKLLKAEQKRQAKAEAKRVAVMEDNLSRYPELKPLVEKRAEELRLKAEADAKFPSDGYREIRAWRALYDSATRLDSFAGDILDKIDLYPLSDRQVEAALKAQTKFDAVLAGRAQRAEAKAEKLAANPFPDGERRAITGRVVSIKRVPNNFDPRGGTTMKMLIETDEGWRVFGTVPSKIPAFHLQDARVRFTGTLERSKDDPGFGFFSRPSVSQSDVKWILDENDLEEDPDYPAGTGVLRPKKQEATV